MLLNQTVVMVGLGVVLVWLLILSIFFYKFLRHYQRLTQGVTKKDLKSVLDKLIKQLESDANKIDELAKGGEGLEKDNFFNLQKIGLVRFNPFAETGGDQSFSLAVLDGHSNGFVVSSLHSRDTTRKIVPILIT